MSVLSKLTNTNAEQLKNILLGREWSFPYNCYEVGHGWTPFCTEAACDIGWSAVKNAVPLYTSLYLFTQIGIHRRLDAGAFYETFKSIVSSSSFLGFNLMAGCTISCLLRNSSERYYYRIQCFTPALLASYMALLIERPSRRPTLAFYMANLSSELIFKWAVSRNVLRPLPHGETLLFSAGMSCYFHFVRVHGFGHDPVSSALKLLLGPLEAKSKAKKRLNGSFPPQLGQSNDENSSDKNHINANNKLQQDRLEGRKPRKPNIFVAKYNNFHETISSLFNLYFEKYAECPHSDQSCVDYSLTPFLSRFALGYLVKFAMNIPGQLKIIRKQPLEALRNAFMAQSCKHTGFFLASLVCVSRSAHCIMRRVSGRQENWHSALAGALGGLSMWFSPRSTMATYVIWKCLEQYFFLAVKNGQITHVNEIVGVVYAVSVNILLYVFALEPGFIRSSYMKFIDQISEHRLHQLNRMVLDVFGPNASCGYEEFFPNLDPKYMSRQFQELIFNWIIQPY